MKINLLRTVLIAIIIAFSFTSGFGQVKDTIPPVINLNGSSHMQLEVGTKFIDPGVTITDNNDTIRSWDTSGSFYATFPDGNPTMLGIYDIVYEVHDKSNNYSTVVREVEVIDTIPPVITLKGLKLVCTDNDSLYFDQGYDIIDNFQVQTDIPVTVEGCFQYFPKVPGTYKFRYKAVDKSGNVGLSGWRYAIIKEKNDSSSCVLTDSLKNTCFIPSGKGNRLIGTAEANNQLGSIKGKALLIKFDSIDSTLTAVDTTDISGNYFHPFYFNDIKSGDYFVKIVFDSFSEGKNYMPTYFEGSINWNKAKPLHIDTFTEISINMIKGHNPGGPGFIAGKVSQGANKKEGDPLEGIEIMVTTLVGEPVAYVLSDANGNFSIKNLALGDYYVLGEVPGKKAIKTQISLNANNPGISSMGVYVTSSTVAVYTTGIKNEEHISKLKIYPNPVSETLNIESSDQSKINSIKIYSLTGQIEKTIILKNQAEGVINVSDLPVGMYMIEVLNQNGEVGRRVFSVVR